MDKLHVTTVQPKFFTGLKFCPTQLPLHYRKSKILPMLYRSPYSLHEGVGFSIHSLNCTGNLCLLGCHDYIAACAGARAQNVCALNIPCLQPHAIQYLLYYCTFIWGTINICVWGGAAKGHLAKRRSYR